MPKISFLIPAYNYEDYIGQCIESVLAQNDAAWDLLIVNDCSTDGTWQICQRYVKQDARIRAINLEHNLGQYQIINEYSRSLSAEYCCVLDADDYLARDYVGKMYRHAKRYGFDMVMCLHQNIADNKQMLRYNYGTEIPRKGLHHALFLGLLKLEYFIVDCGTLIKTSLRQQIYEYLPKVPLYAATDDMQALFLALHARNIAVLKKPLYFHNQSSNGTWRNKSEGFRLKKISSMLLSLQMVYHLANNQAGWLDSLPMAQNIQGEILETLGEAHQETLKVLYQKLLIFFAEQKLPFQIGPLSILELEAQRNEQRSPLPLWKAQLKQRLRAVKPFLPYGLVRYIQSR